MSSRGGRGRGDLPIRESRGGGDRGRGRGDASRGRGDASRGRGDAPRGRGDAPRGRGDASRGRGGPGGDRGRGRGDFRGRGGRGGGPPREQGPRIFTNPSGQNTPSSNVTKTEDAVAKALTIKRQKAPGEPRYPERPGFGTQGQPVQLFANYFELKSVSKELFRYHMEIGADANGRQPAGRKARQVVRLLLDEHFLQYENSITTDYRSTLVSRVKLPVEGEFDVRYREEHEDEYPEDPKVYRVSVQETGVLNPSDLLDYLTSANASAMFESKAEVVQAMNIVMGYQPKSSQSVASIGANRHYALSPGLAEKYNLGAGLEVLRGFFISARAATSRLLVNVQVKYAACYQEGPLSAVIAEYRQGGSPNIYRLEAFLKKLRVRVTHISKKNKKGETIPRFKAIAGLATRGDGTSSSEPPKVSAHGAGPHDVQFFLAQPGQQPPASQSSSGKKGKKPANAGPAQAGRYTTVADFFHQTYNIDVDPNMPVVNVGDRQNPSYLPVDVCIVEAGQPAKSKLTPNQTRNMLNFAVRAPALNAQSIVRQGSQVLGLTGNPILTGFNIQPNLDLVAVPGRVLPVPRICYKDSKMKGKEIQPQFGGWNMKEIRFSQATQLPSWTWIYIDAPRARQPFTGPDDLNGCLQRFTKTLKNIGVAAEAPTPGTKFTLSGRDMGGEIEREISQLMARTQPKLILCILHGNSTEVYNSVKQACDVRLGVRNICVLADKLKAANDQYFANVGLKFNLKLGGANQSLRPTDLGIINEGKTMVVGVDVTHPSPGSTSSAPSVAGMVASIDSTLGQWPAEIKVQTARQEMVADLDGMLKKCLQRWANTGPAGGGGTGKSTTTKPYPENIIVYRDGVSEGQYDTVLDQELPLLKKACAETYPANMTKANLPRIAIIVVGKRHHTRFYPAQDAQADRGANTPNGTVVDRGVTEARNWDFFLQAHTAIKGTARPAHYFTVWDEIFQRRKPVVQQGSSFQNAADVLEDLTHRMCYLFGRATKAVSICPPAYYADLVCERARCYLSSVFDPSPEGSAASVSDHPGGGGGGGAGTISVAIHPNVKDSMFYI